MTELTWSYGITTVPQRQDKLLIQTVQSLKAAGFDRPHLFVDGCKDSSAFREMGLPLTTHSTQLRTTGHWIASLWELWAMNTDADRFALFQDDILACKGLKNYLNQCEWPCEKAYLNLFTFRENHELIHNKKVGWHPSDQLGKAAVGLVFDQVGMKSVLSSPHLVRWLKDTERGHRLIDRAVSQSLGKLGFKEFIHNPSLLQHVGMSSSMGSDRHPQSSCFMGEDHDATNFLESSHRTSIEEGRHRITVRVAIPAIDAFDLTEQCLTALSKSDWPMIVDYVDNGSKPGTMEKVADLGRSLGLEMNCTGLPENVGFSAAVNISMRLAIENNQHCLVLNNDCMVSSDAIRKLCTALDADETMAAVGPVTMDNGGQSLPIRSRFSARSLGTLPCRK